jgi:beta-lactamase superfamily II metal-dependent hydrolase
MGEMHHLEVGCADCSIIKTSTSSFLIDCSGIADHSGLLPSDKKLKAVFITHQHYDHFDGLGYLKNEGYDIDYLIYSPYERRYNDNSVGYDEWQDFIGYREYFKKKGSELYLPYRQEDFTKPWWEVDGIKFYILGPTSSIANSATRELHDASLIIHVTLTTRTCLFTGDASDTSLRNVAENTTNICNDILHASHHGSINGADLDFIKACNAEYTVVSTKSGVHDNIPDPTAMQRYRDHTKHEVYRTDIEGTVKWSF